MTTNVAETVKPIAELPPVEYIQKALKSANQNALRLALFYQTRDEKLAQMEVEHIPVQGGAFVAHSISREDRAYVQEKALEFLLSGKVAKPDPTKQQSAELMELFTGYAPTQGQIDFGYEDLAFDEFSRGIDWTNERPDDALKDFTVTIIGAGFSGLCAAIQLDRLGIKYEIIERLDDIGGTWQVNDYPEARVDVSNFLYQFKFIKNYKWDSYFAPRDELKKYINYVADHFDIRKNISLKTSLKKATWNETAKKWDLEIDGADGVTRHVSTNVVLSGVGLFNKPNLPDIPGIKSFEGKMFHTTDWDHSYDYRDKRIAMIGTGSTGSQLMPELADKAAHLTVFQRTPNWVMPIKGYHDKVSEEKHWLLDNFPGYWNWFIYSNYIGSMQVQKLQDIDPDWEASGGRVNERNDALTARLKAFIRQEVGDRDDLYEKLVPKYAPMVRRLVMDNGFYKSLTRDNVDLNADGIEEITATGILDKQGVHHEYDLIVLCAGFQVSKYLWPVEYTGRDGITLEKAWEHDGARAYLSITMPNFPNMFMYYGPTAQVRGGSFHSWTEVTTRYICGLIVEMVEQGRASIEPKKEAFDAYNDKMDAEYPKLLWRPDNGGNGYFFNEHGRVITNMPFSTDYFYSRIQKADPENFEFSD